MAIALALSPVQLLAGPGDGLRIEKFTISPFVSASLTYDSNVFLDEENEEDDLFIDAMLGGMRSSARRR